MYLDRGLSGAHLEGMAGPRKNRTDADVVIAGGGMVGLALGVALAGAGVPAIVVERSDPGHLTRPQADGRASAIAAGSRQILEAVGVWPDMVRDAEPILEIRVTDGNSPLFLHYQFGEVGDGPLGYIVENRTIRSALFAKAGQLPNLDVRWGRTVVSSDRTGAVARVHMDDGAEIGARLLVAADGRESPVRQDAGIGAVCWRYPQTGIVCTVAHERPHRGIAQERFLSAGPFAILPMTGNRSSIVWTEDEALSPALLDLARPAFDTELARRFGDYLGALEVQGPRFAYPLSLVHADSYIGHRLALAGDAAHGIHPIAGQGLNLGLRDVAALAETVVDALRLGLDCGDIAVLEPYQRRRRFDNLAMIAVTDGLNRLFSNDLGPLRMARSLGMATVNRTPTLKRLLMRHAMGVSGDLPRLARGLPL